jgi:hypothetical protein
MKISSPITIRILGLLLAAALSGCTKNVPGPKGDDGQPGGMGNLKLTHLSKQASVWTAGSNGWECLLTVPEITGSVISKGEVAVYMQLGDQWWKLPHTVGNLFTQAFIDAGTIHLKHAMIHDGPPDQPGTINIKVVISEPVQ